MRQSQREPVPDSPVQHPEHGRKSAAFGALEKRFVETVFCLQHVRNVAGVVSLFDDLERLLQPRDLRVVGLFHKEASCQSLQDSEWCKDRALLSRSWRRRGAADLWMAERSEKEEDKGPDFVIFS